METLRKVEQVILRLRFDGYPIGPDWMTGRGWKVAFDTITAVLTLMVALLAITGMYLLGVRVVMWIAEMAK